MNNLILELERLLEHCSPVEVKAAIGELVKRVTPDDSRSGSFTVCDANNQRMGVFVSEAAIQKPDLSDYHTLLAVAKYRSENPPDRYLSVEEFIEEISSEAN